MTVTVDGKTRDIAVSGDMTINKFVTELKEAGLNANFDSEKPEILYQCSKVR